MPLLFGQKKSAMAIRKKCKTRFFLCESISDDKKYSHLWNPKYIIVLYSALAYKKNNALVAYIHFATAQRLAKLGISKLFSLPFSFI